MIRVADYIMKCVFEENVRHVFYVPGGQCVYLTDALRRNENLIAVAMHHEQAAAMAALSYSLYNENFGCCLVTTGCAGTNTITGLLHAYQDSIPCLFISGQQNLALTTEYSGLPLRQVGIQEADIVGIVKPLTKYASMVKDAKKIAYMLDEAIYTARTGRPGPVWIDVPLDIQNSMVDEDSLERYIPADVDKLAPDEEDEEWVVSGLKESKRPVILLGEGVRVAGAIEQIKRLIEKTDIPTVSSRFAADIVTDDNPCYYGVVGCIGASRTANFTIQNSDFVLSIGCRLSVDTTGPNRDQFAREAQIAVVDIDEIEHTKDGVKIDRFVHSDAKEFLEKLLKYDELERLKASNKWWNEKCTHWQQIFKPYDDNASSAGVIDHKYFIETLSKYADEKTVVVSDAGFTGVITPATWQFKEGQRSIPSFAQGEMGFSLPGAIGVGAICTGTVVAMTGDGSFMMNLQELQTLVRTGYNIKIVIMNNNGYSGVRHGQKAHFRGKSIGTDPSNGVDFPDYEKIAQAFGISFIRIQSTEEIDNGIKELFMEDGPCICEVMADPEQVDLHNALVQYGKRKFGFRPIEDQSPFIDREVFFEEMIVEPMETSYGTPT
jgi:acetolactate synthase-1/2/3 large subunit